MNFYPKEFPAIGRAKVEAEELRASMIFDEHLKKKRWTSEKEECLREYILKVFLMFANEACSQKLWPVDQTRRHCEDFLRCLTIHAYYGKGSQRGFSRMTSDLNGSLLPETQTEFEKTPTWRAYQEALLRLAECQIKETLAEAASNPGFNKWEDIEIRFTSDERVQIVAPNFSETRNYNEFGFADARSQKSNLAWETLKTLAQHGGVLNQSSCGNTAWTAVEKRVEEIRRVFRKHFALSENPLPYVKNVGYQARFNISCSSSFDS